MGVRWRENEAGGEMSFPAGANNMMSDDHDMISLGYGNVGMESKYVLAPEFLYILPCHKCWPLTASLRKRKEILV